MNLKYPRNLWKPFELLLTLQKRLKDEDDAIEQTQFDEIKWFVCWVNTHYTHPKGADESPFLQVGTFPK